jgi:uncharacterized membrane protein
MTPKPRSAALILLLAAPAPAQPVFYGLGDMDGGEFRSQARAVSADGSVMVGEATEEDGPRAVRWTVAEAMKPETLLVVS